MWHTRADFAASSLEDSVEPCASARTQTLQRTLILGDATVDVFPETSKRDHAPHQVSRALVVAGGSGLNVAIGMARMGAKVDFAGAFGGDVNARFIQDVARKERVRVLPLTKSTCATRFVIVVRERNGSRSFLVAPAKAADEEFTLTERVTRLIHSYSIVFATGALLRTEPARSSVVNALQLARARAVPTAVDLNIRLRDESDWGVYKAALQTAVTLSNIVFGTSEELAEVGVLNGSTLRKDLVVVEKTGRSGCRLHCGDSAHVVLPGFRVLTVDTTAAGDAFDAAFLHSLTTGSDVLRACQVGNAAGALTCTTVGSSNSLPTYAAVLELLARKSKPDRSRHPDYSGDPLASGGRCLVNESQRT